jgi:formylmethanofuran dehydrogenase subunit D
MEGISQLDIEKPDHVSVINRDGKVIVSIVKDGVSINVSVPVKARSETSPRPPLQQPAPEDMAV